VTEFVTDTVFHWSSIVYGSSVKYPNFEIVGKIEPVYFFYVLHIFNYKGFAISDSKLPTPIASPNVSTILAGSAITLKCKMPDDYIIGNEEFQMAFQILDHFAIAWFRISALSTGHRERTFHTHPEIAKMSNIASILPVSSATAISNVFEFIITTTKNATSAQFGCWAWYNNLGSDLKYVNITVISLPPPILTSSVRKVQVNYRFTLTCSLPSQFDPTDSTYQVAFFNSRDGLLADYEVEGTITRIASGKVFLVSKDLANISVHHGQKQMFPSFDLAVQEKIDRKLTHSVGEFVTETVSHWTSIVHGASVEYPNFDIVGRLESGLNVNNYKWWCALNFTEPGQSTAQQIKSNLKTL
ncbi:hypothetical protein TYRP_016787, partial [Tyrophagus putrescentiae]